MDREYFTRKELYEFYRYFEPDLKEGTFGWRICDRKDKNIIRSITGDKLTTFAPNTIGIPYFKGNDNRINLCSITGTRRFSY